MPEHQFLEFKNNLYEGSAHSGTDSRNASYSSTVNTGDEWLPTLGPVNNRHTIACTCCSYNGNLLGRAGWDICL